MTLNTETLTAALDELIPPSLDRRLPSAGALGVGAVVQQATAATPELEPLLTQGLAALDEYARSRDAADFIALPREARIGALREVEASAPLFVQTLMTLACVGYYSNEQVLAALNGDARPPHPQGYELEPDDLSALATVRARGKLYREC